MNSQGVDGDKGQRAGRIRSEESPGRVKVPVSI